MMLLADAAVRSAAVVAVGLLLVALLRRRSASLRHRVLAWTVAAAFAVVPLSMVVPGVMVPGAGVPALTVPPRPLTLLPEFRGAGSAAPATSVIGPRANAAAIPPAGAVLALWAAGAALSAASLLVGLVQVRTIARRARSIREGAWIRISQEVGAGLRRPVTLLLTDRPDVLATYGLMHPRVLLPAGAAGWDDGRIRMVLAHELAHVRRGDWAAQLAAAALRAIYWFNPLVWALARRLRRESERAADDLVLASGLPPVDYAAGLLALARECRRPAAAWAAAIPMAVPSTLERRIAAMLIPAIDRRIPTRRTSVTCALVLTAVLLPAAALRGGAQSGPLPFTGVVYDPSGGVLPGVQLSLQDAQEFKWEATTDGAGRFEFPPVQPGAYQLRTQLPGFRAFSHELTLTHGRDWDRAVILQLGDLQETINVRTPRAAAVRPAPESPRRVRVGGNVRAPRKVRHVNPDYPESMRAEGRDGTVLLEAIIGVDGDVSSLRVLGAQVHPDFATAAIAAVRQWQFTPTLLNGTPVEVKMTVTVNFGLAD